MIDLVPLVAVALALALALALAASRIDFDREVAWKAHRDRRKRGALL